MLSARITDSEICPITGGAVIITGMPTVLVGYMPAARVTDSLNCSGTIITGSFTVQIGFQPAARITSVTSHGGVILTGCPTVVIGG
ncbi:MAG: PAAR domain-containing protein [Acidobacteria bacterium]|nr:PAAR domain-containing protein [Acidobacteriota bacterium]